MQIATDRGDAYLVDSLAVDLAPLGPALANPRLVKVLHGADYDVTTLKRDFGFTFQALFDTIQTELVGEGGHAAPNLIIPSWTTPKGPPYASPS